MNAFATLLLSGEKESQYAEMIVILYKSLETKIPFVVMISPDLNEKTIKYLTKYNLIVKKFDDIIADYKVKWKRFDEIYNIWVHRCLSKLNVLLLQEYEKVLFLDADMLARKNIDNIFKLKPPCGILTIGNEITLNKISKRYNTDLNKLDIYNSVFSQSAYGIAGSFMLLEPSEIKYNEAVAKIPEYLKIANKFNPGLDEIAFSLLYENDWYNLSSFYSTKAYNKHLMNNAILIHYVSGKPFDEKNKDYDDVKLWLETRSKYLITSEKQH